MSIQHNDPFIVIDPSDDASVRAMRQRTDKYFSRKREAFEDVPGTCGLWAVYLRGPSVAAFRRTTGFMVRVLNELGSDVVIVDREGTSKTYTATGPKSDLPETRVFLPYKAGEPVAGAGQPMLYYYGPIGLVSELETGELQRLGYASVAAFNAREMGRLMPEVAFIDMAARHFPDHNAVAYGAAEGSAAAQRDFGAKGFIGTSTDQTAHWFGQNEGTGTVSHSFIAAAGSTLGAAKRFRSRHPDKPFILLPDFYGQEVTDSLEVARHFNQEAAASQLMFRLDTHGDRFLEGLDGDKSYALIKASAPHLLERNLSEVERKWLFGKGVSAAALFHFRQQLDGAGFDRVVIAASSGFSSEKCALFAEAQAPVNVIGTGSYVPRHTEETYAKAEILGYEGQWQTKTGREWVLERWQCDSQKFGWSV